jgi:ribonuclease T
MSGIESSNSTTIANRFRGFLPVVIDVETGGFNSQTDALLEAAAVILAMDEQGLLHCHETIAFHIQPFEGANIEEAAIKFTGIDPYHPLRIAHPEQVAMQSIFSSIRKAVKSSNCKRAILVGHNAHFDHGFINAASERCNLKRNPFHPFSNFDTVSMAGLAYGQTVLSRACEAADIRFDQDEAHSARYDAEKTAELFCNIINRWHEMGGWGNI